MQGEFLIGAFNGAVRHAQAYNNSYQGKQNHNGYGEKCT